MGMIKKVQDLAEGDQFAQNQTLYRVMEIAVGETIVGVTTTYRAEAAQQFYTVHATYEVDTEVYLPNVDAHNAPPQPPVSTARVDDFLREHTGQAIRREPGHIPTQFPQ